MKNIQVIDGALNCTFSIFEATDEELALLFPEAGQEIQFAPRPRQFARAGRSVCGVEQNLGASDPQARRTGDPRHAILWSRSLQKTLP
jgi:hypothetical protein